MDWMLWATIGGPILALPIGAAINRFIERRPNVITYLGHVSAFTLQGQAQPTYVFTHSIVIRNAGKRAALNVRVGHNVLPPNFQLIPAIEYRQVSLQGGGVEIVLPRLVPGEQITISYLYQPPLTWDRVNTNVRSDEGFARTLNVIPTPQLQPWMLWMLWGFIFMGIVFTLYVLIQAVLWGWQFYAK